MAQALGMAGEMATMFAIMVALAVAGIVALFMALLWPKRWRVSYRIEVLFAAALVALAIYGDWSSARIVGAYQEQIPTVERSGVATANATEGAFDRVVTVYTYQWGFLFLDDNGGARNAMIARPGEKILFRILSNDVIHGFNIPAVQLITEIDPGSVRSVWIRAPSEPGKYLVQCIDYCGVGHHQMKAWLVVKGDAHEDAANSHGEGTS